MALVLACGAAAGCTRGPSGAGAESTAGAGNRDGGAARARGSAETAAAESGGARAFATTFEPAAAGGNAGGGDGQKAPSAPSDPGAPAPIAVVELYTSEGCSSCPSADAVVNKLDQSALREGRKVYVLAFHVDYWDDIGWRDPFSSAAFTTRQRVRGARAGQRGIYTPEAAVQGRAGFVGSDGARLEREVAGALASPAKAQFAELSIDSGSDAGARDKGRGAALRYRLVGALPPAGSVRFAVTERGLVTKVPSGENAGRTLPHEGVVRRLVSRDTPTGTADLGALPARGSIVAFVEGSDGAILGASAIDIDGDRLTLR